MSFTYCLPNEARTQFNWVSWNDEAVLYNNLSGDTHRALSPGGHILKVFESAQDEIVITANELLKSMPDTYPSTLSEVEELLSALCSIGLLKKNPVEDCRPLPYGTDSSACC